MANTEKSRMQVLKLVDELKIKLAPVAVVETVGSAGDPLIKVGAGVSDGVNAIIRVVPIAAPLAKDILGNASTPYTPHRLQLATEASATSLTAQPLIDILCTCSKTGDIVEWYQRTHGTAPAETDITGTPTAVFQASLYWPLMGQ